MLTAITREVSSSIGRCELTHLERKDIDVETAVAQHGSYEGCLKALGCRVLSLPALPELPDSVFVEDAAVVLDEMAVLSRPGAESRRSEIRSIEKAIKQYRPIRSIEPPGTLDGGDVLKVGKTLYVGSSQRTNRSGVAQLQALVDSLGYRVRAVKVGGCLHLKSAVTRVAEETLLINRDWADAGRFGKLDLIDIAPDEPCGANALLVGEKVLYPSAFPETYRRLLDRHIEVMTVDVSELAKAEGAVTCCSLIFDAWPPVRLSRASLGL